MADESEDEDDEDSYDSQGQEDTSAAEAAAGGGTPGFCRPLIQNPRAIPRPDALPLIEDLELEETYFGTRRAEQSAVGLR